MFALYDTLRAQVRIDEARTRRTSVGLLDGRSLGRLRCLARGRLSRLAAEPEVARREQGVWRLTATAVTVVPTALKVCVGLRYLLPTVDFQAWQEVRGIDLAPEIVQW